MAKFNKIDTVSIIRKTGIVPVFYSLGNHEVKIRNAAMYMDLAEKNGVTLLRDESALFRGILDIYGTSSVLGRVYWVVGVGLLALAGFFRTDGDSDA